MKRQNFEGRKMERREKALRRLQALPTNPAPIKEEKRQKEIETLKARTGLSV